MDAFEKEIEGFKQQLHLVWTYIRLNETLECYFSWWYELFISITRVYDGESASTTDNMIFIYHLLVLAYYEGMDGL